MNSLPSFRAQPPVLLHQLCPVEGGGGWPGPGGQLLRVLIVIRPIGRPPPEQEVVGDGREHDRRDEEEDLPPSHDGG